MRSVLERPDRWILVMIGRQSFTINDGNDANLGGFAALVT